MTEEICVICLDPLTGDDHKKLEACTHQFHVTCVDDWISRGNHSCPTCRQEITLKQDDKTCHFCGSRYLYFATCKIIGHDDSVVVIWCLECTTSWKAL